MIVRVPWDSLPTETLNRLVEEFVTRDGTDYGEHEVDTETKVVQVLGQLRKGDVVITFDSDLGTANIVLKKDAPPAPEVSG
ncbi:MAG: YheU family protein [Bradymonadia bacterium]